MDELRAARPGSVVTSNAQVDGTDSYRTLPTAPLTTSAPHTRADATAAALRTEFAQALAVAVISQHKTSLDSAFAGALAYRPASDSPPVLMGIRLTRYSAGAPRKHACAPGPVS